MSKHWRNIAIVQVNTPDCSRRLYWETDNTVTPTDSPGYAATRCTSQIKQKNKSSWTNNVADTENSVEADIRRRLGRLAAMMQQLTVSVSGGYTLGRRGGGTGPGPAKLARPQNCG